MRFFDILVLLIGFGALGFAGYTIYGEVDGTNYQVVPMNTAQSQLPQQHYEEAKQFYPNLRFPDKVITYGFDQGCTLDKKEQIARALNIFEERTVVSFIQVDSNPQLFIACSELAPDPEIQGHFVAGEGGPTKILNGTLYTIILEGKISLYEDEDCSNPHIAVHELLHVFGFDHTTDPQSILYPTLSCSQVYNSYFFERINELYAVESLPDLVPQNIELERNGRYIQFTVEVANQGLKNASNVNLTVMADTQVVDSFSLGNIDIGTRKIFKVENLRVPRDTRVIEFIVDRAGSIQELSETNNNAAFNTESKETS